MAMPAAAAAAAGAGPGAVDPRERLQAPKRRETNSKVRRIVESRGPEAMTRIADPRCSSGKEPRRKRRKRRKLGASETSLSSSFSSLFPLMRGSSGGQSSPRLPVAAVQGGAQPGGWPPKNRAGSEAKARRNAKATAVVLHPILA